MKISALWITKNEEANIGRSMDSVREVADEMVVVDTGSSDNTVAIAQQKGARVEHFEWVNDFSAARNWALQQVDGDVVIFLDADEWFNPALKSADRKTLQHAFAAKNYNFASVRRTNLDPTMGTVLAVDHMMRIMRGHGAAQYVGAIHEFARTPSGQHNMRRPIPGLNLDHDGYMAETSIEKGIRNRDLLRASVNNVADEQMKALYHYYLMRECLSLGQEAEACDNLQWLLDHPAPLRSFMQGFGHSGAAFLVDGLLLAANNRRRFNRVQLHKGIVENTQILPAQHPLAKVIPLLYQVGFDFDGPALLAEVDEAYETAEGLRKDHTADLLHYFECNIALLTAAGQAAWLLGQRERAFDYATKAARQNETALRTDTLALLLRCVKGLPTADIILFLNSVLKTENRGTLETLISAVQYEGFSDLYAYYVKKLLDSGRAKKSDFWYMLIVMGKAEEACRAAAEELGKAEAEAEVAHRTLFLAIASTQSDPLYEQYKAQLGLYAPVLEKMITKHTGMTLRLSIAIDNYQQIAFAGGREAANRFLAAYEEVPAIAFAVSCRYYMSAGLYAEFLQENIYGPTADDLSAQLDLCECYLMSGNHHTALLRLQALPAQAGLNDRYFNLCSALAATAEDEALGQEAIALYEAYHALYEEWVDWQDVANTGRVFDSDSKKGRRALEQMTAAELDARISPQELPPFAGQLETAAAAAGVFAKNKSYEAAVRCCSRVLEYGVNAGQTFRELAQIFENIGNIALAEELRLRAKQHLH